MATSVHDELSGLNHLVEAATALTKLVSSPPPADASSWSSLVEDRHAVSDDDERARKPSRKKSVQREIFPQRLMAILEDSSLSDICSWLPHGRSFVIIRPDLFTTQVLPKYLPPVDARGSTKYSSFTRKLNRWGFRQATRGPDTGAFHHPLFSRDKPHQCLDMVCQRSSTRDSSAGSSTASKKSKSKKQQQRLTKESLKMMQTEATTTKQQPRAVSVDDTQSVNSAATSSISSNGVVASTTKKTASSAASTPLAVIKSSTLPSTVSNDPDLVAAALVKRDEEERMRMAKSMLYDSFLQAMKQQQQQQV